MAARRPITCYAGMFGEPSDMLTGWGEEPDFLPASPSTPAALDHAAVAAEQHATLARVLDAGTELLKKHGRS